MTQQLYTRTSTPLYVADFSSMYTAAHGHALSVYDGLTVDTSTGSVVLTAGFALCRGWAYESTSSISLGTVGSGGSVVLRVDELAEQRVRAVYTSSTQDTDETLASISADGSVTYARIYREYGRITTPTVPTEVAYGTIDLDAGELMSLYGGTLWYGTGWAPSVDSWLYGGHSLSDLGFEEGASGWVRWDGSIRQASITASVTLSAAAACTLELQATNNASSVVAQATLASVTDSTSQTQHALTLTNISVGSYTHYRISITASTSITLSSMSVRVTTKA